MLLCCSTVDGQGRLLRARGDVPNRPLWSFQAQGIVFGLVLFWQLTFYCLDSLEVLPAKIRKLLNNSYFTRNTSVLHICLLLQLRYQVVLMAGTF